LLQPTYLECLMPTSLRDVKSVISTFKSELIAVVRWNSN